MSIVVLREKTSPHAGKMRFNVSYRLFLNERNGTTVKDVFIQRAYVKKKNSNGLFLPDVHWRSVDKRGNHDVDDESWRMNSFKTKIMVLWYVSNIIIVTPRICDPRASIRSLSHKTVYRHETHRLVLKIQFVYICTIVNYVNRYSTTREILKLKSRLVIDIWY